MATSYSSLLRLELPGNGDQSGVWGSTTNNNLGTLLDQAIAGTASITMLDADYTLSAYNGVTDESRQMILNISGTLTANRNIICPSTSKLYVIKNNTTGGFSVTLKTASGTGVTVTNGNTTIAYCDNTNVVDSVTALPANTTVGGVAIVTTTGTQTLTNKTLTAPKFADGGFIADANGNEIVVLDTVTSAVNEITVSNAATAGNPAIAATGGDTNISLNLVPKGTGVVQAGGVEVATLTGTQALSNKTLTAPKFADLGFIADANGNELIVMDTVTSAVNEIKVANAAAGGSPSIVAQGGDTNVNLTLTAKGAGTVNTTSVASFAAGTLLLPSIIPSGDPNTGVWFPAADTIAFSTAGTEDFRLGPLGQFGIAGANYGTAGQVITSGGASAAPSWASNTPAALSTASGSAPSYSARAWVNFDGTAGTISPRASANVSSITDNGSGNYTINFTTAMADVNYSVVGTFQRGSSSAANDGSLVPIQSSMTTSGALVRGLSGAGSAADGQVFAAIFR